MVTRRDVIPEAAQAGDGTPAVPNHEQGQTPMQATNDKHNMIPNPCVVLDNLAPTAGIAGLVHMTQPMTLRLATKVSHPDVELKACFKQMVLLWESADCLDEPGDGRQRAEPPSER